MSEYAEREIDSDELFGHYARHVNAMTAEGLHGKSDIAAELAWRDARIEELAAHVERLTQRLEDTASCIHLDSETDRLSAEVLADAPAGSLARLKAQWQAEAVEHLQHEALVCWQCWETDVRDEAARLRRQAEETRS